MTQGTGFQGGPCYRPVCLGLVTVPPWNHRPRNLEASESSPCEPGKGKPSEAARGHTAEQSGPPSSCQYCLHAPGQPGPCASDLGFLWGRGQGASRGVIIRGPGGRRAGQAVAPGGGRRGVRLAQASSHPCLSSGPPRGCHLRMLIIHEAAVVPGLMHADGLL